MRNLAGLTVADQLEAFETLSVTQRSEEALPDGAFDAAHFRAVHRHLFQDVYDWAGEPRTIRMFKETGETFSPFCYPEHFDPQLEALFGWLSDRDLLRGRNADAFAEGAAHFLSELNVIHLFREGNGRAQSAFVAMLAAEAGHPLDLGKLDPAGLDAGDDSQLLCRRDSARRPNPRTDPPGVTLGRSSEQTV